MTTDKSRADALTDARIIEIAEDIGIPDAATDDVLVKLVRACIDESAIAQPAAAPIATHWVETEWPVKQIGVPHPSDKPTIMTCATASEPIETCACGYSVESSCNVLDPTCKRRPAPAPADERAARAEAALRALVEECENDAIAGWEERMRRRLDNANRVLARAASANETGAEGKIDSHVAAIMERDAWRNAMQGLCTAWFTKPDDAADHLRQRLKSRSPAMAAEAVAIPTEDMRLAMTQETPYFWRRAMDKSCYEVGVQTNDDWREVISDDQTILATFNDGDAAADHFDRLEFAWRYARMLEAAPQPAQADARAEQFPYQKTFNAIAAATSVEGGNVSISVKAFREAFGDTQADARDHVADARNTVGDRNEAPLIGRWHHGNGVLVCGSIRVAVESFDTQPSQEFMDQMFDWICETLNTATSGAQADARERLTEEQRESVEHAATWLARSEDLQNKAHAERLRALLQGANHA
ncbi:hypothetical protein [Burkholderia cepacia]|uniref:hypothetical protein n=1 Tax=Burkholderia cepacia TaxID=292 RepID=UPI003D669E5B